MKRFPIILGATGWLLYVLSFFLPWVDWIFDSGTARGWEVPREFMDDFSDDPLAWLYTISTVVMLASPLTLLSNWPRLRRALPHAIAVTTLLNLVLLVIFIVHARDILEVGYYLWCTSYVLVTCGLYLIRRERLRASQG